MGKTFPKEKVLLQLGETSRNNSATRTTFKVRMGPKKNLPVENVFPVNSSFLTVSSVHFGASQWLRTRPVDEQEVRQVCSILHETCTLIDQLFEMNIFVDWRSPGSRPGSAESRDVWALQPGLSERWYKRISDSEKIKKRWEIICLTPFLE